MRQFVKLLLILLFSTWAYTLNNIFPVPDWFGRLQANVWTLSFEQVNLAELGLYILSGLAFWLLWRKRKLGQIKWSAMAYGGILIASSLWSLFFFGHQMPILAFIDMLLLTALTVLAFARFYRHDRRAAYLVAPCVAGALFFTLNNFMLYQTCQALGIS